METKTNVKPKAVGPVKKEVIEETVKDLEAKIEKVKASSLIKIKNISDRKVQVGGKVVEPDAEGMATAAELSTLYLYIEKV